jgi:hypothetical protein
MNAPSGVSDIYRVVRSNSFTPRESSRDLTCLLIVDRGIESEREALWKLCCFATSVNICSESSMVHYWYNHS